MSSIGSFLMAVRQSLVDLSDFQRADCVLVVDGEPVVRAALAKALASRGYTVRTAARMSDVVAIIDTEAVDVIVTDLQTADAGSVDMMALLRKRVRIVDLSGKSVSESGIIESIALFNS